LRISNVVCQHLAHAVSADRLVDELLVLGLRIRDEPVVHGTNPQQPFHVCLRKHLLQLRFGGEDIGQYDFGDGRKGHKKHFFTAKVEKCYEGGKDKGLSFVLSLPAYGKTIRLK